MLGVTAERRQQDPPDPHPLLVRGDGHRGDVPLVGHHEEGGVADQVAVQFRHQVRPGVRKAQLGTHEIRRPRGRMDEGVQRQHRVHIGVHHGPQQHR